MEMRKRTREQLEQASSTQAAEIRALEARVKALKAEAKEYAAWQKGKHLKRDERDREKETLARYAEGREEVLLARYKKMRLKYTVLLRSIGGSPGGGSTSSSASK
jgi:hypothetical protein